MVRGMWAGPSAPLNMALTCRYTHLLVCLLVRLSVGRSVRRVYCGKTADCTRMPFEVVSGVGVLNTQSFIHQKMVETERGRTSSEGKGQFWG